MEFFAVTNELEAIELRDKLPEVIAIDTEYDQKDTRKANLLSVLISNGHWSYAVPPEYLSLLTPKIKASKLIFTQEHNRNDTMILLRYGCDLRETRCHNLIDMHHLQDENSDHDLGSRVLSRFNDNYKEEFWAKYKNYADASEEDALIYACKDAYYTYLLGEEDMAALSGKMALYEHKRLTSLALFDTELKGLRVDVPLMQSVQVEMGTKIASYLPKLYEEFKSYCKLWELQKWIAKISTLVQEKAINNPKHRLTFSFSSDIQVGWLLYEALKLPVLGKTKKKKPSVDYDTIVKLVELEPRLSTLLEYKDIKQIYATFVKGMLERVENSRIYPNFNVSGTVTHRLSHSNPNMANMPKEGPIRNFFLPEPGNVIFGADYCLHVDTEYLTPQGWKTINALEDTDKVWQVNKDSLVGNFVSPIRKIIKNYCGNMYEFGNKRGSLVVTENHRMLWVGQQTAKQESCKLQRKEALSQEGAVASKAMTCFSKSDTKSNFSESEIWLACALQADGYYRKDRDVYTIEVSIERKKTKLRSLIGRIGVTSNPRKPQKLPPEKWNYVKFSSSLLKEKELDLSLLGENQAEVFLQALSFWDSSTHGKQILYYTTNLHNAEEVQRFFVRSGYGARLRKEIKKNKNHSTLYILSIRKAAQIRLRDKDVKKFSYAGLVGCVTVPSGYIMVRNKGQTFLTGNCQIEIVIEASLTDDPALKRILLNGESKHDVTAQGLGLDRDLAKKLNFTMGYGAGVKKVKATLKCSDAEAEKVFNDYWNVYSGCKALKEETNKVLERDGGVTNIMGYTRHLGNKFDKQYQLFEAQRQAYNFLIQGPAGMLCNIAYYKMFQRLQENGRGRTLISVHDEIVCECKAEFVEEEKAALVNIMEETAKSLNLKYALEAKAYGPLERWAKA